ncbi:MAG: phosphomannomutase/phosphoglucomutase, partial [Candidatus Aenigmarchaeota archaeon]|nr:phosphomannomutase/phosphoglucomutase [Candidatus Aenigmarchaeota archaeon]
SLKSSFIDGFLSTDKIVYDIGLSPTPMVIFAVKFLGADGGVNITASHNPKDYNGLKFFNKDALAIGYDDGLHRIEEMIDNIKDDVIHPKGKIIEVDVREDYSKFLRSKVSTGDRRLKVVTDFGNGVAGVVYPDVIKSLGFDVISLYTDPDGNFPNHHPDPTRPENLRDLRDKIREVNADVGFAYDGDGDRLVVLDENGNVMNGDVIFSMLIKNIGTRGSKIVKTIMSSMMVDDVATSVGCHVIETKVGHSYIQNLMKKEDAVLAGEVSGHYYFKDTFYGDDAIFATLKILEILSKTDKKISDFSNDFPKYYSEVSESMRFPIKESLKFKFIEELKEEFLSKKFKIVDIDGVKVIFNDGWALFRASNTEPKISVAYESKTKEGFERIGNLVNDVINRIPR